MKTIKTFLFSAVVLSGLASCVSETLDEAVKSSGTGYMSLNVNILEPSTTRAKTQVTDFPVTVKGTDVTYEKKYDAVSEIPASVKLAVGNYTVESHTPGVIQKRMSAPYYKGIESMEIKKGITSDVEVICKMQNSSINVNYSDDFRDVFSSWTVTLDDGSETALDFNQNSGTAPIYWYFGENGVEKIAVTFCGVTKEGSRISQKYELTKDDEYEGYDDTDNKNFTGGDAIVLNLTPTEATTGKVTGLNITANVTFSETGETVKVYVSDKQQFPEGGEDDDPSGDEPGGEEPTNPITLNLPSLISYKFLGAKDIDKSLGDTYIKAEKGIKSITVKITSTSNDMVESVGKLKVNYNVDFIEGTEIVGNNNVETLFEELNQPLTVPQEGDIDYTFPIGNFFELLQVLIGEHTFWLSVTDMDGKTVTGDVKITITY